MASQATGHSNKATRLLKCFCGCQELTEDEVKRIYQLPPQKILSNPLAKELFQKYLENERGTCPDKSETENNLIMYGLCEQMITNRIITEFDAATLSEKYGLQFSLEKELKRSVKTGDFSLIKKSLESIQENCVNKIQGSIEYKEFKKAILNKLNSANK